jgi:hypothetical protein
MPEEQYVHADHDGYRREHVKQDACLPSHRSTLLLEDRVATPDEAADRQRVGCFAHDVIGGMAPDPPGSSPLVKAHRPSVGPLRSRVMANAAVARGCFRFSSERARGVAGR